MENFCSLYEKSPEKNSRLFFEICKKLTELGIIQSEDVLDEMASVRSTYKKAFRELVVEAVKRINSDPSSNRNLISQESSEEDTVSQMTQRLHQRTKTFVESSSCFTFEVSRYHSEFLESTPLGAGSFGQVWKAKNKLDGIEYAIKKVRIKMNTNMGLEKILREVKYLARLNHPNVVRYFSSWIELCSWTRFPTYDEDTIDQSSLDSCTVDVESSIFEANYDKDEVSISKDVVSVHLTSEVSYNRDLVLFIQMELCDLNLHEWIFKRNSNYFSNDFSNDSAKDSLKKDSAKEEIDSEQAHRIFMDILSGLEYIHGQGCIHRDLKPQNIYKHVSNGSWKLGDFGLATSMDKENAFIPEIVSGNIPETESNESFVVGTVTYASPEQLAMSNSEQTDSVYSSQSDIYSLGIIFFELLFPFKTFMERAHVLTLLRQGVFPEEFLKMYPKEAALILWLMSHNPSMRPTASQLIELENLRMGESSTPLSITHSPFRSQSLPDLYQSLSINSIDPNLDPVYINNLKMENKRLKERVYELELLLKESGISL